MPPSSVTSDQLGHDLTYSDGLGREQLRAAVLGEQRWLESLTRVLAAFTAAEQAASNVGYDRLRGQLVEDITTCCNSALVTCLLRRGIFRGPDLPEFTGEVWQRFKQDVEWRVRDAEGKWSGSGHSGHSGRSGWTD